MEIKENFLFRRFLRMNSLRSYAPSRDRLLQDIPGQSCMLGIFFLCGTQFFDGRRNDIVGLIIVETESLNVALQACHIPSILMKLDQDFITR